MRKELLLAAALVLGSVAGTKAQYTSIGPVAGFGHSWTSNMPGVGQFKASPYMGVGFIYAKNAHWGWGGELGVSHEGYMSDIGFNTITVNPVYLRMPLRAYYFFGSPKNTVRPKVYLGPSVGLKVDEVQYMNGSRMNNADVPMSAYVTGSDSYRSFDLGLNTGAGVNIRLMKATWLNLDLGYNLGLLDAVEDVGAKYNMNENMRVNVGFLFGLK